MTTILCRRSRIFIFTFLARDIGKTTYGSQKLWGSVANSKLTESCSNLTHL